MSAHPALLWLLAMAPTMCAASIMRATHPSVGRVMPTSSHGVPAFQPLDEEAYTNLFVHAKHVDAAVQSISVVAYQPKWDREGVPDVGPILAAAAERWQSARFFSMPLVRGTPTGERIFAALNAHGFDHRNMPILDVFCGDELIDTMVLPQGDGGGAGAACPLFTERARVDALQQAIDAAQRRVSANRRWRERRRVLLKLRQIRNDLRRLARYKASGGLGRSWLLAKQTNTIYRDPARRVYSPERMRRERRKHLLGVLRHARQVGELQGEARRLERRWRHLATLVLGRQRCDENGCVLRVLDEHDGHDDDGHELDERVPRLLSVEADDRMANFEAYLAREQEACDEGGCVLLA